jgi:hypothetical protein
MLPIGWRNLPILRHLLRKITNAAQLTLDEALQQDNQVFTRVHNTHLWLVLIDKNKPLTLSSTLFIIERKKYLNNFLTEEKGVENFLTCRGPFSDLDLHIHVTKSQSTW